ncbi:Fpg/Nei family DNA glycosylase [soil metagenome]
MPEGDTIHRAAAKLAPVLDSAVLRRFEAPRLAGPRPRVGETIESVVAVGKHLQVNFSGGLTLETHMRMTGSWHVYRQGEKWRKPAHLMRCAIVVDGYQAVCFSAPVIRTFPTAAKGTVQDPTVHLGPDLVVDRGSDEAQDAVVAECVLRMTALDPATPIGEVLLDQRIGNGIGNVYKSDVCWIEQVDPFKPLSAVDEATRTRLIATASRLLKKNLGPGRRRTVAEGLAVYGRRNAPCRRCGAPVRKATKGELARITYWCPNCQH